MKLALTLLGLALATGTSLEEDYETHHHRVEHREAYRVTKKVSGLIQKPRSAFLDKKPSYPLNKHSSRAFEGGKKPSLTGKGRGVKPIEKYPVSLIKKTPYPKEKRIIPVEIPFELAYPLRVPVVKQVPLEFEIFPYDSERSSRYPILKPVSQLPRRGVRYEVKIPVHQVPIAYSVPRKVPVYLKEDEAEEGRDLLAAGGGGYQGYAQSRGAFNYAPREAGSGLFFSTVQGQYPTNHIGPFS